LEQHSLSSEQASPRGRQLVSQAGSPSQSGSAQSVRLSQSSSAPLEQLVSLEGEVPQSRGQLQLSSPGSQLPSPQKGGAPQSTEQLVPFSEPSQVPSPQQEPTPGTVLHSYAPSVQRGSAQPTLSPQQ
jgi:hypothetical protein